MGEYGSASPQSTGLSSDIGQLEHGSHQAPIYYVGRKENSSPLLENGGDDEHPSHRSDYLNHQYHSILNSSESSSNCHYSLDVQVHSNSYSDTSCSSGQKENDRLLDGLSHNSTCRSGQYTDVMTVSHSTTSENASLVETRVKELDDSHLHMYVLSNVETTDSAVNYDIYEHVCSECGFPFSKEVKTRLLPHLEDGHSFNSNEMFDCLK